MIITVSREFGSGGRELGKRLADLLGYDYYDREIIEKISKETGFQEDYIEKKLDQGLWKSSPLAFRRSFSPTAMRQPVSIELLVMQTKVIQEIAKSCQDFVIVGRCADVILAQYHPLKLFVYADMESKIRRCVDRANENEHLSEAEMIRMIRKIDDQRSKTRAMMAGGEWGMKEGYHLMINTTGLEIKALTPVISDYAKLYSGGIV